MWVWLSGLVVALPALGQEEGWDRRLAHAFSGRLAEVEAALEVVKTELPMLPSLPLDDQGGTGGFARLHSEGVLEKEGDHAVELKFAAEAQVEMVALVPSRRYELNGLNPQFGMPDDFTIELLDAEGGVVEVIAREDGLWGSPVRVGHPFVYVLPEPLPASGMRISAGSLPLDSDVSDGYVHAWAEAFVFDGDRNVASQATVVAESGRSPLSPWHWQKEFLVDGQTPLGLPEVIEGEHRNVGWISNRRASAKDSAWLELDLGEVREFDGVKLFPAKRPTADLPSGFGFPTQIKVSVSDRLNSREDEAGVSIATTKLGNPGHNPFYLPLKKVKGRYVRIDAMQLWKEFESYPAFFALSEIQVLNGTENVAIGAGVRSPDSMGNVVSSGSRFWSAMSLCDGFGPDGKLVSRREWLKLLDQRLVLETERYHLQKEAAQIVSDWRRVGVTVFGLLAVGGAFVIVALPLRYRVREKRELAKVRERIAGDLHDEVGSNLGSIQMFADLADERSGAPDELKRIQRIAAETVSAVRDIVWLLRPGGDHRIGTVEHLRETSSIMLEPLKWDFAANEEAWQSELSDEHNRHLFLFFREALHNILRHASATEVKVKVEQDAEYFRLMIEDNGCGIDEKRLARKSTLRALRQRVEALEAIMEVKTASGDGTRLSLEIPLDTGKKRRVLKR
ncbi:histidine kinase [Haloferula sp.]|uniref:histidine kinase n=1 Tax=Haloferula sp. TaxID=2497595 RepID=UPI0032A11219